MVSNLIKKIWLICLWLTSLFLVGCFHIPDEDWLPSRNKVNTWDIQKNNQVEQALNSLIDWIDMISSQRSQVRDDETKNDENEASIEELKEITDEESIDWEETEDIITEE